MTDEAATTRRVVSTSRMVQLRQEEEQIRGLLAPVLAEFGLLPEHWRILAVIDDHPGIAMSTVAASAVVPGASLTRHVDRLTERGLVLRHIDPEDRRRVVVTLSSRGAAVADRLRSAERGARSDHEAELSPGARSRA